MPVIHVLNISKGAREGVYIGRVMPGFPGSPLANPFSLKTMGRIEALGRYRTWLLSKILEEDPEVVGELRRLQAQAKAGDLHLLCWCRPWACHGDIIAEVLKTIDFS